MKRSLLLLGFLALFSASASSPVMADEIPGDIVDHRDYDPNKPFYETLSPSWAIGFRFTLPNFPYIDGHPAIYDLFAEKFLPFQQAGVFSAGVHLGTASFRFAQALDGKDLLLLGLSARYQAYFMRNQIIVPTVGFVYDNFRWGNQAASSYGLTLGGLLNLNFFDPVSARQGAQGIGLLRSYISVEVRPSMKLTSDGVSTLVGNAWYFGVLTELE